MINAAIWSGLRSFHWVAVHLSFTRAARELSVTTGAVSQQVKQLESRLGCPLFVRTTRQLCLTEEGQQLAGAVSQGYAAIDAALNTLAATQLRGSVRLAAIPSFCFQWLVPRLGDFYRAFPEIDLHIDARDQLQGVPERSYDLALDYRLARADDAAPFLTEWLLPVCSPERLPHPLPLQKAEALLEYPLLHDSAPWVGAQRDAEWQYWFSQLGLPVEKGLAQRFFNRADLAVQAAEAGQGIALGRLALVADRLASGQLVIACDHRIRSPAHYYLHCSHDAQSNSRALALRDWLLAQTDKVVQTANARP